MVGKTLYTFMSGRLTDGHSLHPFLLANAPRPSIFPAGPGGRCLPAAAYTTLVPMSAFDRCFKRNIRQLARQPWKQSPRTNSTVAMAAAAEAVQHPPRDCHVSRMPSRLRQGCVNVGCFRAISVGGPPDVRSQDGMARSTVPDVYARDRLLRLSIRMTSRSTFPERTSHRLPFRKEWVENNATRG